MKHDASQIMQWLVFVGQSGQPWQGQNVIIGSLSETVWSLSLFMCHFNMTIMADEARSSENLSASTFHVLIICIVILIDPYSFVLVYVTDPFSKPGFEYELTKRSLYLFQLNEANQKLHAEMDNSSKQKKALSEMQQVCHFV